MGVLVEGSPISTEELWSSVRVTIGFLVTSLTKALIPLIAQFGPGGQLQEECWCFKISSI